jgi:uncharacterized protein (TIGR03792 family)
MKLQELAKKQAVEQLVFRIDPQSLERCLQIDHEIWTKGLASQPGFAGKEVWLDPKNPDQITYIIYWDSLEQWKAIDNEYLCALQQEFEQAFAPDSCTLIRELHNEQQWYRTHVLEMEG